jgi:hypothetical protein
MMCNECGLSQLEQNYPLSVMYGPDYGYRSSLNRSMVEHLEEVADKVRFAAPDAEKILDIGSNDGTFLSAPAFEDMQKCGVDPSAESMRWMYPPDVDLKSEFFSRDLYQDEEFDIVSTIAMFYDLPDPILTAMDIWDIMKPGGLWVLEVGDLLKVLENKAFDTICHEHLEYYRLADIKRIAAIAGFDMVYNTTNDVNGGSLLVILRKVEKAGYLGDEVDNQFWKDMWKAMAKALPELRKSALDFLEKYPYACGLGASTKGNILLQYFGIDEYKLYCIAEINKDKFGKVTPGTNIPIVDEKTVKAEAWFVLPWHFKEGILKKYGDKPCYFPLPYGELYA